MEQECISVLNTTIYHKAISSKITLSNEEWTELEELVTNAFPDFRHRLTLAVDNLSKINYRICLLIKIGVNSQQMSVLLCRSREAIVSARRRLAKKHLSTDNGTPEDWNKFISSL